MLPNSLDLAKNMQKFTEKTCYKDEKSAWSFFSTLCNINQYHGIIGHYVGQLQVDRRIIGPGKSRRREIYFGLTFWGALKKGHLAHKMKYLSGLCIDRFLKFWCLFGLESHIGIDECCYRPSSPPPWPKTAPSLLGQNPPPPLDLPPKAGKKCLWEKNVLITFCVFFSFRSNISYL